jgi:hypothetical protein
MPGPDGSPVLPPRPERLIRAVLAPAAPGERAFGPAFHNGQLVLTAVLFSTGSLLLWVFGYTFWVLIEAVVRAAGLRHGHSIVVPLLERLTHETNLLGTAEGWPLDAAIILGVLATAAALYLALDHIALLGNGRAQRILERKAARLAPERAEARFFVEIKSRHRRLGLGTDVGYLLFYSDRLVFIGDSREAFIPRDQIIGDVAIERSRFGGLTGAWVSIELAPPWGRLRLLARDGATTLSGTGRSARHLAAALSGWLAGPITGYGADSSSPLKR